MPMYLDHLQKWFDYGYGMLVILILALFWLSGTGHIWVCSHFRQNPLKKWPEILHADVSWSPPERIRLWSQFVVFCLIWALFWVSEMGQIWDFRPFWSCSVDFNHYDASLTATGHIWGFWALSGECVGVNADRGGGIFLMLCIKFCLVFSNVLPWVVLFCMSNASKIIETNVLQLLI